MPHFKFGAMMVVLLLLLLLFVIVRFQYMLNIVEITFFLKLKTKRSSKYVIQTHTATKILLHESEDSSQFGRNLINNDVTT